MSNGNSDFPTDDTKNFRIGPPEKDVEVRIDFIYKAHESGFLDTSKPTVPRVTVAPLMHGTKPDWKVTALSLGQKYLVTRYKWIDAVELYKEALRREEQLRLDLSEERDVVEHLTTDLRSVKEHWSFFLLPSWLKKIICQAT